MWMRTLLIGTLIVAPAAIVPANEQSAKEQAAAKQPANAPPTKGEIVEAGSPKSEPAAKQPAKVEPGAKQPGKAKAEPVEFPKFDDVGKAVVEHLAQTKDYKPGDLLTASDVQSVFATLEKLGWKVADQKEIAGLALNDNDYLVVQLRTNEGRKTMRKVGLLPMAYDYMDRLRNMPHGTYRIREIIEGPDGYKLIQYMSMTKGGNNMAKQLTKAQDGQGFTQPTGRVYNEPDLLARLKMSYDLEAQKRGPAPKKAAKKSAK